MKSHTQMCATVFASSAIGKCNSVHSSWFFTTPESCACCLGHSWMKHFLSSSPNLWVTCLCKLQSLSEILRTQGAELAAGLWLLRGSIILAVTTAESFQPMIVHRQYVHPSPTKEEIMHFFLMWKWFYPFEMLMSWSVLFVLCRYSILLDETFSLHLLLTICPSLPLSLLDNPLAFFYCFVLFLLQEVNQHHFLYPLFQLKCQLLSWLLTEHLPVFLLCFSKDSD